MVLWWCERVVKEVGINYICCRETIDFDLGDQKRLWMLFEMRGCGTVVDGNGRKEEKRRREGGKVVYQ